MSNINRSAIVRIVVVLMVIVMIVPVNARAASETATPRASYYLDSYNTYIYPAAFGKIQVWFSVTGVNYMDDLGTLSIQIFESTDKENWTWVKTYTNGDTPSMLGHDDYYHSGHVDYQGTIGRYYKAYVCIWAGKDGDGDTRYMWTDVQRASLLAG